MSTPETEPTVEAAVEAPPATNDETPTTEATAEEAVAKEGEEEEEEVPSRQEMYRRAMEGDDDGEPMFVMMDQMTTALIVLSNQMLFKPEEDVIHLIVIDKKDLATCLEEHVSLDMPVADGSLEQIHLVIRAADVDRMFDETAFRKWNHLMQPGGLLTVHIVSDGSQVADSHIATMQMSLMEAELKLTSQVAQEDGDGSKVVEGRKAGGDDDNVIAEGDEDSDDDEENKDEDHKTKTTTNEEAASS